MKIIKESLALLLTAALLFGLLPGQPLRAYAAETEQPATVSVENSVFTVTPAVSTVCPGSELTLTVSVSGNNAWRSLGYIPVSDSDVFEVISGEVLPLGQEALINDFSITDGGVLLYSEPIARSGDLFSFTIHIKEDAPVGEYTVSNTAAIKNGSEVIPFILNDALITVCTEPSEEIVAQGTCGENLTWTLNEEGVLGVSGSGDMYNYCAPDTYAPWHDHAASITSIIIEDGVTSIGEEAFRGCEKAISVTIPASVTDIGAYAFGWCYCLTKVAIPDSVTSIALCAFYNCQNLTDITIGTGVTTIGVRAFENCLKLKSIIIPDSVVSIGSSAFQDCYELTSITIGTGVTNIGNYAFDYCYALEEVVFNAVAMNDLATANYVFRYAGEDSGGVAVTIGPDVTKIPAYLFCPHFNNRDYDAYVTSITFAEGSVCKSIGAAAFLVCKSPSLTLPDGLTDIGEKAFWMSRIDGELIMPDSVTNLGHLAFQYCRGIKKLVVGNGITEIGASEFRYCTALESVVIPEGICSIGQYAFAGCTKLTSVEIPCSVTTIGMSSFGSALTDVYYLGTAEQWVEIAIDNYNDALSQATIHCGESNETLVGISVHTVPDKVGYITGESLDATGLSLLATYSDGSTKIITEGYVIIHSSFTNTGTQSITVSYDGFSAVFSVTVVNGGACGDNLVWTLDDDGTLTISGTGVMTDYYYKSSPWYSWRDNIKKVVVEDGVTTLSRRAFSDCVNLTCVDFSSTLTTFLEGVLSGCTSLESIIIPNSVTDLGASAFADCTSLVNVTLPEALTRIEYATFVDCDSLTTVTIPSSVTMIGTAAFQNCDRLSNITIPDSVTVIYNGAFSNCKALSSVMIGKGVSQIGANAFNNCVSLSHITIPGNVATFDHSVFSGCTALTEVIIENGVTTIGELAFCNCTSLAGITIPDSVTVIGGSAFNNCPSLTDITLPDGVTMIGKSAFQGCTSLASITIPDGVTEIGEYAFCDCDSLTSITIPANVAIIGNYAFLDCNSLTGIWVDNNNPIYSSDECGVLFNNTVNTQLLQAPCKLAGSYIIPGAVAAIDDYAFYNCDSLTCVTIPESVTEIGYYAFSSCKKLVSVTIPVSVTRIDEGTFEYCYSLTDVTIPNTVTMIGTAAFFYCTELSSVTMGNGVNTVYEYAFHNCTKLTDVYYSGTEAQWAEISIGNNNENLTNASIHFAQDKIITSGTCGDDLTWTLNDAGTLTISGTGAMTDYATNSDVPWSGYRSSITSAVIEDGVTSIGAYAFYICRDLTNVSIGNNVTNIGDYAFQTCDNLTNVVLPDSLLYIGENAFSVCASLTSLTIPDSVLSIGNYAFQACSSLTSVDLGKNLTTIGGVAFSECSNLSNITIPDNVTSLGWSAFAHCTSLETVMLSNRLTEIGSTTFYRCCALNKITIPSGIASIGQSAFADCTSLSCIDVPDSVASIGGWAFENCTSLSDVHYVGSRAQWIQIDIGNFNTCLTDATIHCAGGIGIIDSGICGDNLTWVLTGDNVLTVSGSGNMYNYTQTSDRPWNSLREIINTVVIEDGVEYIGISAFMSCSNLTTVVLPTSVTRIGAIAFFPCDSLTDVYYSGNSLQWSDVTIGSSNYSLTAATVHYAKATPELTSIEINQMPVKTQYIKGEALDVMGLTITLLYADSYSAVVTEGFTVTGFDSSVVGTQTLTVFYEDLSTTFEVKVEEPAPEIITQPGDVEITAGFTAQFTVEAANAAFYKWQYRRNETAPWVNTTMSGYATATLTVPAILGRDGYQYRCCVTGNDGTVLYTEPATLTVNDSIIITSQPSRQIVCVDANATFTVEADGAGLTYQWLYRKNADDFWKVTGLTGNKTNTLTVPALAGRNGYQYRCAITDENGIKVYSNAATLSAIGFTSHPADQIATVGAHAVFTVTAKGQNLSYQWQYRKAEDGNWMTTSLTGAQTDTLTVGVLASRNGYQYRCVITDINGVKVYSDAATLTVK